jgi:hypothetical protein
MSEKVVLSGPYEVNHHDAPAPPVGALVLRCERRRDVVQGPAGPQWRAKPEARHEA